MKSFVIIISLCVVVVFVYAGFSFALAGNTHSTNLVAASSQYWSIPHANQTGLNLTGNFTLSVWVKAASTAWGGTISKGDATSNANSNHYMNITNTAIGVALFFGSLGEFKTVPWSPSIGTWYHIAFTKEGDTGKFYVNGVQRGANQTYSGTSSNSSNKAFSVGSVFTTDNLFNGKIDDVRVWSRALSSSEISSLYSDPCGFNNGASLQGWWLFDNDGTDKTANNNHLTNNNSATFSTDVAYTCGVAAENPSVNNFMKLIE